MQPKAMPAGTAGGAAICRACETVWLDHQAVQSLPDHAAAPGPQPTLGFAVAQVPRVRRTPRQQLGREVPVLRGRPSRPHPGCRPAEALPGEAGPEWVPWRVPHRPSLYSSVLKRMIEGRG